MTRMDPLTSIAQHIVEENFGTGEYKEGWHQGFDPIRPIKWTTIECASCKGQVYFDILMKRHRCCKCGAGF